jgi:8-oxo-dGTP pyrophosphatase MutT (NUDIX family)
MQIKAEYPRSDGVVVYVTYYDVDSFEHLLSKNVTQSYGICFYGVKLVIVYNGKKKHWSHVGGSIEKGETFEECLRREIKEESNMRILSFLPIGYQEVLIDSGTIWQLRYVCMVEPYGDFISDPDGGISEIKLVDPKDYGQYVKWGEIGDHIVKRALEMLSKYNEKNR